MRTSTTSQSAANLCNYYQGSLIHANYCIQSSLIRNQSVKFDFKPEQ